MNTLPFAKPSSALSEGLIYRFRLRPLTPSRSGDGAPLTPGDDEFVFDCMFSVHVHTDGLWGFEQEGTCTTPSGETVKFRVNDPAAPRSTVSGSSQGRGGTRSSWTPPPP